MGSTLGKVGEPGLAGGLTSSFLGVGGSHGKGWIICKKKVKRKKFVPVVEQGYR